MKLVVVYVIVVIHFIPMDTLKSKSAAKKVLTRGPKLEEIVLRTAADISNIVGGTLGPGGHPVLIERYEFGLPPSITKDGVTVFQALGYEDAIAHCVMETMRDVATRTASEAGDGTTTATILSEAIIRLTKGYVAANPGVSAHAIVSDLHQLLATVAEPALNSLAAPVALPDTATESKGNPSEVYANLALSVATISANGDSALGQAVLDCFAITGDDGNVSIIENSGAPSRYEVERIDGYPIATGFEVSCPKYYPMFINDTGTQKCIMDAPIFILYHGRINDMQTILELCVKIQNAFNHKVLQHQNVVIVALGFSESVVASLAMNFVKPDSVNFFPLVIPKDSPIHNVERHFLDDLAAITSTQVYDPYANPLSGAELTDLGNVKHDPDSDMLVPRGVRHFEASRYRSTVIGMCDPAAIEFRADELRTMVTQAGSILDRTLLQDRLAKLTGGIAKLKVIGGSSGELKERRDRAEDAVCAVRGALKHGAIPGGGWALARIASILPDTAVAQQILKRALLIPIKRLYANAGIHQDNIDGMVDTLYGFAQAGTHQTFNCLTHEWGDAFDIGVIDSVPAVREALRNSISAGSVMGTLGGIIAFPRDREFERQDAREANEFMRNTQEFDK